jgi:hypothetical protein
MHHQGEINEVGFQNGSQGRNFRKSCFELGIDEGRKEARKEGRKGHGLTDSIAIYQAFPTHQDILRGAVRLAEGQSHGDRGPVREDARPL